MGDKKNRFRRKLRTFLNFIKHLLIAAAAMILCAILLSSVVVIDGKKYVLNTSDAQAAYEDSALFNTFYGRSVADIIRFCVISSQFETDGKFDGQKIIDITAYNYRNSVLPEQYVTAGYYLEDLLKWYKYGVEKSDEYMTYQELASFLADKTMVTTIDPNSQYYNTSDAHYLKSDMDNYTFVDSVSANMLPSNDYGGYYDETEGNIKVNVLINRYKSVEGKNIEAYTADLQNYYVLCDNLELAMNNLDYNYNEYVNFKMLYASGNTNVRYCIEKTVDGKTQYYTNMEDAPSFNKLRDEYKNGFRYIYYSPSEMIYESNTSIDEDTVNGIIKTYDYAYPEDTKIWIGVDTSYPADDVLAQGREGYQNYLPHSWQWGCVVVGAVILYLLLFVYLTINAGREIDDEGKVYTRLTDFDKMPTEITAAVLAALVAVILIGGNIVNEIYMHDDNIRLGYVKNSYLVLTLAGLAVFVTDVVFGALYYSIVRRIKAGVLWQNSYMRKLARICKKSAADAYKNSNIIVKAWLPYMLFVGCNLLGAAAIRGRDEIFLFIFVFAIDIVIGAMFYGDMRERQEIIKGIERICDGDLSYQIDRTKMHGDNKALAEAVNSIRNAIKNAVEVSMKDERMKTELITNVSHDIKTPLTSIINYVDLIKREDSDNERIRGYIKVLDDKSQRLKQLIDDLVEASKISSGNISLNFEKINLTELINQTIGEFSEKFDQKGLNIVLSVNAANAVIEADSRSIWRVMENLFNNVYKYALERTRVYISINNTEKGVEPVVGSVELTIKNISATELNCDPAELTERFIRGDESRTTEGSGLGLSIAKSLTEAQHGTFEIQLDGDLFKVILTFPVTDRVMDQTEN